MEYDSVHYKHVLELEGYISLVICTCNNKHRGLHVYIYIPIIDLEFRSIKPQALDVRSSIIDTV